MMLIEWKMVIDLREDVGHADFEEIVALFMEEVEETLSRIEKQALNSRLADDLHFLEGSALNMGFAAFAAACRAAEKAPAESNMDELKTLYFTTKDAYLSDHHKFLTG